MGSERAGHGLGLADRQIHIGEQIRRIGGVEIGRFGGIHYRAAADRYKAIKIALAGELRAGQKRAVGGLDLHRVIYFNV